MAFIRITKHMLRYVNTNLQHGRSVVNSRTVHDSTLQHTKISKK